MVRTRKYSRKRQNTKKRKLNRSRRQRNYKRRNYKKNRTLKQRGGADLTDPSMKLRKSKFFYKTNLTSFNNKPFRYLEPKMKDGEFFITEKNETGIFILVVCLPRLGIRFDKCSITMNQGSLFFNLINEGAGNIEEIIAKTEIVSIANTEIGSEVTKENIRDCLNQVGINVELSLYTYGTANPSMMLRYSGVFYDTFLKRYGKYGELDPFEYLEPNMENGHFFITKNEIIGVFILVVCLKEQTKDPKIYYFKCSITEKNGKWYFNLQTKYNILPVVESQIQGSIPSIENIKDSLNLAMTRSLKNFHGYTLSPYSTTKFQYKDVSGIQHIKMSDDVIKQINELRIHDEPVADE